MRVKTITIPLSEQQFETLRECAAQAVRRPRDHATFLILEGLKIKDVRTNANRGAVELETKRAAVAG